MRRAITVSHRTRQSPRPRFHVGITCGSIIKGTYTSADSPTSIPWKPGGPTPTTAIGWPLTSTLWPTTRGSAPNRRVQNPWPSTTTGCAPGVRSSSSLRRRPAAGRRPSTPKNVPETSTPSTWSVWFPTVTCSGAVYSASAPSKASLLSRSSTNIGCDRGVSVSLWLCVAPEEGPGASTTTSRSGSFTGSRRNSTWSMSVKIAVLAPMPRARVRITTSVKPGLLASVRSAYRRSCLSSSIVKPGVLAAHPRTPLAPRK